MGRIKSAAVKRLAKQIKSENLEVFSKDFNKNKEALRSAIPNKRSRNLVTGYITKLMKKQS